MQENSIISCGKWATKNLSRIILIPIIKKNLTFAWPYKINQENLVVLGAFQNSFQS